MLGVQLTKAACMRVMEHGSVRECCECSKVGLQECLLSSGINKGGIRELQNRCYIYTQCWLETIFYGIELIASSISAVWDQLIPRNKHQGKCIDTGRSKLWVTSPAVCCDLRHKSTDYKCTSRQPLLVSLLRLPHLQVLLLLLPM